MTSSVIGCWSMAIPQNSPSELADLMQPGIDRLREFPGLMTVERQVGLDPWLPGQFGTLDVGIINDAKREAVIWDWKWGAGVPVSPVKNPQLMLYALGFWNDFILPGLEYDFRLIIEQPRIPGGGGEWVLSHDELMLFGAKVHEAGQAYRGAGCTAHRRRDPVPLLPGASRLS